MGQRRFHWTDTKTGQTHAGDLLGLPPVGPFVHMFLAPGGETFAVWNPFSFCPTKTPPDGKLPNGGKFVDGNDPNWASHPALAHRLVVYRKTGEVVKSLSIAELLTPEEMREVRSVFHTARWLSEYPGLTFRSASRVAYGTYRVSPDYTVLEATAPKLDKAKTGRTFRLDLTTGRVLDIGEKLDGDRLPMRPFVGPDVVTQDEQYLWQPSLDPVRTAGTLQDAGEAKK